MVFLFLKKIKFTSSKCSNVQQIDEINSFLPSVVAYLCQHLIFGILEITQNTLTDLQIIDDQITYVPEPEWNEGYTFCLLN